MAPKKSKCSFEGQVLDFVSLPSFDDRLIYPGANEADQSRAIGRNLKALRVQTFLTSQKLAQLSGVSHTLIRSVENGHRSLSIGAAFLIAQSTGVDVSSLLYGDVLLEWGGAATFTTNSYNEWVERGRKPSPRQRENGNLQVRNICNFACDQLGVEHHTGPLLAAFLKLLLRGVDQEIQYAGVKK